jgi:hypothetical protein
MPETEQKPGSEVATLNPHKQLDFDIRLSKGFAESGMFPDVRNFYQAVTKIQMGRSLGLTAQQSMTGIYMVKGNPVVGANLLATFVQELPDYRYAIVEHTNAACEIHFFERTEFADPDEVGYLRHAKGCPNAGVQERHCDHCQPSRQRPGEEYAGESRFDDEDAGRAHLLDKTSKGADPNHVTYPRNMKFNRAMSNGVKWYCPKATGGIAVYTEGEIPTWSDEPSRPAPSAETVEEMVVSITNDLPEAFRERFRAIYDRAQEVRPGTLSPAAAQMALGGQDGAAIEVWLRQAEELNRRAEDASEELVTDAVVVPEDGGDGGDGGVEIAPEVARARIAELEDKQTALGVTLEQVAEMDEEIAYLRSQLPEEERGA